MKVYRKHEIKHFIGTVKPYIDSVISTVRTLAEIQADTGEISPDDYLEFMKMDDDTVLATFTYIAADYLEAKEKLRKNKDKKLLRRSQILKVKQDSTAEEIWN